MKRRSCCARVVSIALALALSIAVAEKAGAAQINLFVTDAPGEGFNDPTPAAPVGGNPATTRGQQRRIVLESVADLWGERLQSNVPILANISFDSLECGATSAVLASAGPTTVARDFQNAPRPSTWYVAALANSLAGEDLDPSGVDLSARFNSNLGAPGCGFTFYLGLDANPPEGAIDLFSVALHEFGHGLGFVGLFNGLTGQKLHGFDDAYLVNLIDSSTGQLLSTISNGARAAACVKPDQVLWTGDAVAAASSSLTGGVASGGRVPIFTPAQYRPGSSVSHFTTSLVPNELMEPSYTGPTRDLGLTSALFEDLGWGTSAPAGPCVASSTTLCLLGGRFAARLRWDDGSGAGLRSAFVAGPKTAGNDSSAGLFYFFAQDPNNWEVLVKMIDGCNTNGSFWVLVSASTGYRWELTLDDLTTGESRLYEHPLDGNASGVANFGAFSCAP